MAIAKLNRGYNTTILGDEFDNNQKLHVMEKRN